MPLLLPKSLRLRFPSFYITLPTSLMNPLTLLSPIILLTLSVPLYFLALLTSTLAFYTLALRVGIVYFELGRAVITSWVLEWSYGVGRESSRKTSCGSTSIGAKDEDLETFYKQQQAATTAGKRRRRSHPYPRYNLAHNSTSGTIAPTQPPAPSTSTAQAQLPSTAHTRAKAKSTSSSFANLRNTQGYSPSPTPSYQSNILDSNSTQTDLHRDFEGIGGWRFPIAPPNSDDDREDAVWMSFNSRLELPTPGTGLSVGSISPGVGGSAVTSGSATPRVGHHRRSLTTLSLSRKFAGVGAGVGGQSPRAVSPEAMRMSPLESRSSILPTRSPGVGVGPAPGQRSGGEQAEGSYFTMQAEPQMSTQGIMSLEEVVTKERIDARRRSISTGRSSQSSGSSGAGITSGGGMGMSAFERHDGGT